MSKTRTYLVPSTTVSVEQVIKKSRFIATAGRAVDRESAIGFVKKISEKYPDATHNCYAFVAGNPMSTTEIGMGDDGEVPGTAGKPMLSVLKHKNIGEIVAVVTRYFGGIKLGPGGLVRAYTSSLQLVIEKLELVECFTLISGIITAKYNQESVIRGVLGSEKVDIADIQYKDKMIIVIQVPEIKTEDLADKIMNQTRGQASITWQDN